MHVRCISWVTRFNKFACEKFEIRLFADCEKHTKNPNVNIDVRYVPSNIDIKWGFWRSIGASGNKFAIESFMDENGGRPIFTDLDTLVTFTISHLC